MATHEPYDNVDDWVRRAVLRDGGEGGREALGKLYDHYVDGIFRYCLRRLFTRAAAEDVTSSVFLAVAESIGGFAGRTGEDFANWLYAIASNKVKTYLRQSSRRRALLAAAIEQGRIHVAESTTDPQPLDWPRLYEAIAGLSVKQQCIVTLRSFEQLSFDRIAAITQMKPTAARVIFHRALKKLRSRLQNAYGAGEEIDHG